MIKKIWYDKTWTEADILCINVTPPNRYNALAPAIVTVGDRTVALNIIARCSITQTPTGQWSIDNVAD